MTDVLIGVHVHTQPDALSATLASLTAAGGAPFRVVLLPDGPDPATRAALRTLPYPQDGAVTALGPPACFNRLARRDRADVIVLLESGCTVGPGWLEALLAALGSRPGVGLAGPSTNLAWNQQAAFPGGGGTRADVIATAQEARRRFGMRVRSLAPLHGLGDFCLAVTRPVLDAVGAADELFGLGPCWEMEYCARALRAGFHAVWACGAYVHRAEFTPRRAHMERELFEASKRRYQDAVCGLRLSGARDGYATHCRGAACTNFAPPAAIRIHRPLRPAPSVRVPPADQPPVSCIMPTRDRAEYVLHALDLLERQDYRRWELIVVDDGRDGLGDRLRSSEQVRYVRAPPGESIGAKRNRACGLARGEVIVHWDDDDWYAPARLRSQIEPVLSGEADITALRAGTFLDLERWTFWRASPALHRRMFVHDVHGGTLAYRRDVWAGTRFPDSSLAEDAAFLHAAVRRGARLRGLRNDGLFLYVRHARSAWRFSCGSFLDERGWIRVDEPELPAADRGFLADRSAAADRRSVPLVSCVMPTADRRDLARRAIAYFERQDHPASELVILDDGDDRIADLIPPDSRIRYVAGERRLVLGAKRNALCELARGDVVLHWDDDDWAAPHRIRYQLSELQASGAEVCGTSSLLYLCPDGPRAWRYEHGGGLQARWVAGNTLCYERDAWRRGRFAEIPVGEDSRFLTDHRRRLHVLRDYRFIVGIIHAANASPKRTDNVWWRRIPVAEIERVLGADAAVYLTAAS
jgi:glycosyltransferase involved in cell wall biosynthesis/GT2 family glycosyltransferase